MSRVFFSRFVCSVVFVGVVLLGIGVAADVHAQDQGQGIIQMQENQMGNDERAKAHFRVGTSLYEAGRFNEAAEEWQKAFELSQRSELLYNVYVAYRDAATSNDKAIGALRRYLELGTIEATRRLQLEARLRAMEEAQAQATQNAAPAAVAEPAPVASESAQPVTVADSAEDSSPSNVGPILLMAGGGALLVASVITGVMANGVESDLEDKCPNNLCPAEVDLEGERSKGNTLIALNAITGVAGVLALGTGVVWLLMNGGNDDAAPTPPVSFGCGINGCAGQVTTRF